MVVDVAAYRDKHAWEMKKYNLIDYLDALPQYDDKGIQRPWRFGSHLEASDICYLLDFMDPISQTGYPHWRLVPEQFGKTVNMFTQNVPSDASLEECIHYAAKLYAMDYHWSCRQASGAIGRYADSLHAIIQDNTPQKIYETLHAAIRTEAEPDDLMNVYGILDSLEVDRAILLGTYATNNHEMFKAASLMCRYAPKDIHDTFKVIQDDDILQHFSGWVRLATKIIQIKQFTGRNIEDIGYVLGRIPRRYTHNEYVVSSLLSRFDMPGSKIIELYREAYARLDSRSKFGKLWKEGPSNAAVIEEMKNV